MENWYKIRTDYNTVYDDVKLHLFGPDWYKSGDKVHQTHERTHGINARLRDKQRHWDCWYYVSNDTAFCLNMPDGLRIRDIAKVIPSNLRGTMYETYVVSGNTRRYWDDEPGYLLDELAAYHNGTLCAKELLPPHTSEKKKSAWTNEEETELIPHDSDAIYSGYANIPMRYKYSKKFFYELLGICGIIPELFPEDYDRSHFDGLMEFMRAAAL